MKQQYRFLGGKMNKDADERLIPDGQYIEANNLRIVSGDGEDAGVFKKFKGTTNLYSLPLYAATLGVKEHKGIIYIFYLDTSNDTRLYKYDIEADILTILMTNSLGNQASDAPFDMDIIDDEDVQGDNRLMLYWNDKRNEPQKVNITKLEASTTHYAANSDILVSKPSSLLPPTLSGGTSGEINNLEDKNFQFAYRWVYEDGEVSPLTPFSGIALEKEDYTYNFVLGVFYQDTVSGNVYYKYSLDGATTLSSFNLLLAGVTAGETFFATSAYGTPPYAAVMGTVSGASTFADSDGLEIDMYTSAYPFSTNKGREWINIPRETNSVIIAGDYFNANNYPAIWILNRKDEIFDLSFEDESFSFNSGYGWTGLASSEYGDVIYASYQKNSGEPSKVVCSTDGGATWNEIHDTVSASTSCLGCTVNGDMAYFAEIVENGAAGMMEVSVYKSTNKTSFEKCSTSTKYLLGEPTNNYSSKIYTSSDGSIVYIIIAATDSTGTVNYLLSSVDGGKTFSTVGGNGTEGLNRNGVTVNFSPIKRLSVNTFGNVVQWEWNDSIWSSSDYGETITEIQSSLTSGTTEPIGMESAQPDEIKGRDYIENTYNYIDVIVQTGNKHVKKIEIYAKDRENGSFSRIKEYDKDRDSISDNTTQVYRFKNDGVYQILSRLQQDRLFDNTPLLAQNQALVENRLVYANYSEGRSLKYSDGTDVSEDATVTINGTAFSGSNYKTLKTGTLQSYGILYKDAQGRPSSILPIGDVPIPYWHEDDTKQVFLASIAIGHFAPEWASTYSIVRKKPRFDYDVIYRFEQAEARDGKIYLLLPTDVDASSGYKLVYAGDGLSFSDVSEDFAIIEVVDNSQQALRLNLDEGKWIVLNEPETDGFKITDIVNSSSKYLSGCFYIQKTFDTEGDIVYYETPYIFGITYDAINDVYLHDGTVDQTFSTDATVTLSDDYDTIIKAYPYREEYEFSSLAKINTLGRGWYESEDIGYANRYSSIIWSDVYSTDNNYNGLSNFNPSDRYSLPTRYGDINKIHYHYSNLLVLQDDIPSEVPVNKNIIYGADGDSQLRESNKFLGTFRTIDTLHGCTSPESFSYWGGYVFYADKKRGKVSLLSGGQHSLISDDGMSSYFRTLLKSETGKIYSAYNPQIKCFMMALPSQNKTILFRPSSGFSGFQDIVMGQAVNDGYFMYSIFNGNIFSHDTHGLYNSLYDDEKTASFVFSANKGGSAIKVFESMLLESDDAWDVTIENSTQSTAIDAGDFERIEGYEFAYIPMDDSSADSDETLSTKGVGYCDSVLGTEITLTSSFPRASVCVGDDIWKINSGVKTKIGTVNLVNHTDKIIGVSSVLSAPINGDYIYSRKSNYIDGNKIRDYYGKVTLEHSGTTNVELYAVGIEVKESKN